MTVVYAPDVSEFQPVVDDSFNREWLSFRLCFNGRIDSHAAANLAWCVKARTAGKIKGFTGYVVPLPGGNDAIMASLDALKFPADAPVMIDGEKWAGTSYQINGDHSAEFNDLATRLRKRQGGRAELVWAYGNRGPDLEVWPHKALWLGWVVAGYGGDKPDEPNMIGWQYTDGEPTYDRAGAPSSTPPFGRCDHNEFYALPEGDDMPTADEIAKAVKQVPINQAGDSLAEVLRATSAQVDSLTKQVATLQAQVAKLHTEPVDAAAVAQQIIAHLALKVVAK